MVRAFDTALAGAGYAVSYLDRGYPPADAVASDILLIDALVGGSSGIEVCRRIRASEQARHVPIIVLTRPDQGADARTLALMAGADDAVDRDVSSRELVARLAGVVRRSVTRRDPHRRYQDPALQLDGARLSLVWRGIEKSLSPAEFEVVWTILSRSPAIVSAETLSQVLRNVEPRADASRARQLVRALHRKVDQRFIEILRGWGYRYVPRREAQSERRTAAPGRIR